MIFISLDTGSMPVILMIEDKECVSTTLRLTSTYARNLAEQLVLVADQADAHRSRTRYPE